MMTEQLFDFELSKIAGGGAQEQFTAELKKIADNILDLNTEAKTKRKLTMDLVFIPNDKRDAVQVEVAVKSKLAPQVSVATTMLLGRDMDTGMTALAELKSGVPGQTYFDPDDSVQKTDTGKPIDEVEAEYDSKESKDNVIDLQNQG
ncbi:replication terminator protein [Latilactobacillus phage TMW 1.1365 P2]|nr:replication terminator protein [Latilactobacillus phage TMW 1.1365 P2]